MIAMFSRCIEYIVVKISTHFTPYLIESTLELLESTGVDFCTFDRFLSSDFVLCSFANYSDKVAKDELLSVPAQPLSCSIAQYRALSCKIAHYFRKSAKIIGLFFGRNREML